MSASTVALVLATLGVFVSAVSAGVAVAAFVRSGRHASRLERLEAEALAHATGYRLTVEPSDWDDWTHGGPRGQVIEVVAHVANTGAVDSPPVAVECYVDDVLVGESGRRQVPGKRSVDVGIRFFGFNDARDPEPWGDGRLELAVIGPAADVLASWPPETV